VGPAARPHDPLVEAALGARITIVLGTVDVGKTSLVTHLANGLLARGFRVAIVDADVGQSEIGPPTTIGLGRVSRTLSRPAEAEPLALHFVGATSAARDQLATVVGTRRMADRAVAMGFERVVVDTSGLIGGELGRRLKQAKIDALAPDLIVALQRRGECEPILQPYDRSPSRVLRLPAVVAARRRTADERRRHREHALAAHFAAARTLTLDLSRVVLRGPPLLAGEPLLPDELREAGVAAQTDLVWGEWRGDELAVVARTALTDATVRMLGRRFGATTVVHHAMPGLIDTLAGLADEALDTLGLGVVRDIDFATRSISVRTAVDERGIVSVTIGRERFPGVSP
jgi:polynucleotide 5'-hydroxyl-kinase GRC3/NOL9